MTYQTKSGNEDILHSTRNRSSKGQTSAHKQDIGGVTLPKNGFFTCYIKFVLLSGIHGFLLGAGNMPGGLMTRTAPAIRRRQKNNFLIEILLPRRTFVRRRVQIGSVKIIVRASPSGM